MIISFVFLLFFEKRVQSIVVRLRCFVWPAWDNMCFFYYLCTSKINKENNEK